MSNRPVNPFEEDENREKSISGRIRAYSGGGLVLGASFYQDYLSEFSGDDDTGGRTRVRSAGGQVQWSIRSWALEVEFVAGTVRPSEGPHVSRRGHTSMVSYTLTDRWTPYLRLETLDPNISDTTRQCRDASPVIRAASGRSFSTWRSRWRTLRSRRSPLGTPTRRGDCA